MRGMTVFVPVAAIVLAVALATQGPASDEPASLGSPVLVEGTVAMSVEDDFQSGRAVRHYFLDQSGPGKRYDLRLTPRQAGAMQPGMRVRIIGRLAGTILTADQADDSVMILDPTSVVPPAKSR
jgi:hypothetical protein